MNKIITSNGVIDIIVPIDARKNGTGEYYMICPICNSSRKPEHQKEAKFAINLQKDPMPWRCNHCGEGGYVITEEYMKRAKFKPIISKMDFLDLTDSMVTWFWEQRKISIQTLRDKKISMSMESIKQTRVTSENEHQKDKWIERKCINFKYFKDNILINVKFRDANKNFKMIMDATRTIYNIDSFKGKKKGIFVEGECFTGETEVLTRNGWLRFDLYNGEEIMQASSNYPIKGAFVKPDAIIRKDFSGLLVELKSKNYYSLTTPEHNIITQTNNKIENQKRKAINVYSTKSINGAIPITVQANNDLEGIALSDDQIRFCVAVSADMTIREKGDIYSAFKKERKVKRMISMLDRMHLRYSNKIDGRGWNSIFIHRNQGLNYTFKYFPHEWIGKLNNHQIGIILEELLFWDGNSVPKRTQIEYSTIWYENAVFIQTLSHMRGMASSIIRRKNKFGSWYKISVLKKNHVSLQVCLKRKLIPYKGQVYCVNVPSGAILIRHNEKISVSGNCDVLAYCEAGLEKEYGIGSVPNGATITAEERKRFEETGKMDVLSEVNLEYLDLVIDELNHIEEFYIATDDDPPGIKLREELARRLGRERCKYIRFSDYKNSKGKPINDPNELLIEKGANVLAGTIDAAIPYPISGVSTASQYWDVMKGFYDTGKPRGISTGYTGLDPHFNWMFGWLTILGGYPNSGKALDIKTELPTPDGFKTMENIKIGDVIYDENGKICNVTFATGIMYDRPCYEIEFSDHSKIKCDGEHLWFVYDKEARSSRNRHLRHKPEYSNIYSNNQQHLMIQPKIVNTKYIAENLKSKDSNKNNFSIDITKPIENEEKQLDLHPYILGLWLGDGCTKNARIALGNEDANEIIPIVTELGYEFRKHKDKFMYGIIGIIDRMRNLNLIKNKHIPDIYFNSSIIQRLELLQGLMDTDGFVSPVGRMELSLSCKKLAYDAHTLICSLGIKASIARNKSYLYGINKKDRFRINFTTDLPVFKLKRKLVRIRKKLQIRHNYRSIIACNKIESIPVKCIQVDSPNHLYLATKSYIPTHNTGFALNMIAITIVLYKWKWGIYCPENYPIHNIIDIIAEILVGKSLDIDASNRMCKEEYDDVVNNYINKYVYFVDDNEDGYTPADIRKIKKSMVKQYGIVGFFTDPWSSLVHNYKSADSEDKYLEHQLSLEVRLTTKFNIINLIAHHPRTPIATDKAPSVFTFTGGKIWWIKAFAIFTIHRRNVNDWQNLITEFHVQKQKDFKAAGELTNESNCPTFKFDRKSRRFIERKDNADLNGTYDQYPFEIYQETNQLLFEGF